MSREGDTSICCLLSRVQDVFNLLDVTLLTRIEHQLLEVLSSQPAPIAPQPRPRISLSHSLCANGPMRCRCWAGGCPWTPGNIKSTPTRSSARQRTRSSRRPCRTRARAKGPKSREMSSLLHPVHKHASSSNSSLERLHKHSAAIESDDGGRAGVVRPS